jgi:hypothetical protein
MRSLSTFFPVAHEYLSSHYGLDALQKHELRFEALSGDEIVDVTARIGAMNLYLPGTGGDKPPIKVTDALGSLRGPAGVGRLRCLRRASLVQLSFFLFSCVGE